MMNRFQDKVVVITGGGSGVGIACQEKFLKEGAKVVLADATKESLIEAYTFQKEYASNSCVLMASSCVQEDMEKAMAHAKTQFGKIDILVNCAESTVEDNAEEMPLESWEQTLNVILNGTFLACRAAVPYMKEKKIGRIINISSVAARGKWPANTAYAAAKAGILGLTRAMAVELASFGITVNSVAPGPIKIRPEDRAAFPDNNILLEKEFGSAKEIAHGVLYLASDGAGWITGDCLDINGGSLMQN